MEWSYLIMALIAGLALKTFMDRRRPTDLDRDVEPDPDPREYLTEDEIRGLPAVELMQRTIYGEARGSRDDQELVNIGHVIMNRVESRHYPSRIHSVILQPWQFSPWNYPPDRNGLEVRRQTLRDRSAASRCMSAARVAYGRGPNPIPDCFHFLAKSYQGQGIQVVGDRVVEAYVPWAVDMRVVYEGEGHYFLAR